MLFVEDDALVREAVAQSRFGVLIAESGDAALAMLEDGAAPDVIFSDIVMPRKISGIDLAGIVKQRFPGVQVLGKPYAIEQVVAMLAEMPNRG